MKRHILTILALLLLATLPARAAWPTPFAWGAEVGTSVDVSGHDMSTINLDAYVGAKNVMFTMMGVGAGVHMMVNNATRTIPVYALLRTSFSERPQIAFMELRAGVAFDNVSGDKTQTVPYVSPALGFHLARSSRYASYLRLAYIYNGMRSFGPPERRTEVRAGLHLVSVALGITF